MPGRHDEVSLLYLPEVARSERTPASIRHSRRNPRSLAKQLEPVSLVAWADGTDGRIGLSTRSQSLVFERAPTSSIVLVRVAPAKGPGGSLLELQTSPPPTPIEGPKFRAQLTSGSQMDSLDATADLLSRFWSLPVVFESAFDD